MADIRCSYLMSKGKAIPVTGCGGPEVRETSRLPHFLDNRLTDGSEFVKVTSLPPFTPGRLVVLICVRGWTDSRASIRSIDLTGNRTRDFPSCSIVPQPTTLPRAPTSSVQVSKEVQFYQRDLEIPFKVINAIITLYIASMLHLQGLWCNLYLNAFSQPGDFKS
jgi:hypothetical protein